jgi:uncharacterized protein (TIGR00730 family)
MRRLCVFCGSNLGTDPAHPAAALELADALAAQGIGLVYGGAHRGLMGVIADRLLALGGEVIGVIPAGMMEREMAHRGLTKLHVVASMHERKALMAENADAFLAMPGGFGTLEELMEVVTWKQLGFHDKPIAVLNTVGYYDPFLTFVEHATKQGFIKPEHAANLTVVLTPLAAIARLFPDHL